MTASNLAIVFGPTLLNSPDEDSIVKDMNASHKLIETLVLTHEELFDQPSPQVGEQGNVTGWGGWGTVSGWDGEGHCTYVSGWGGWDGVGHCKWWGGRGTVRGGVEHCVTVRGKLLHCVVALGRSLPLCNVSVREGCE